MRSNRWSSVCAPERVSTIAAMTCVWTGWLGIAIAFDPLNIKEKNPACFDLTTLRGNGRNATRVHYKSIHNNHWTVIDRRHIVRSLTVDTLCGL